MAMENGPFEDVFPIKHGNSSFAMLVYWRVQVEGNGTCCFEDPHKNSKQIRGFEIRISSKALMVNGLEALGIGNSNLETFCSLTMDVILRYPNYL